VLAAPFYFLLFTRGAYEWTSLHTHLFMWTPAIAALLTSLILRRKVIGFGFKLGRFRYYLVSYLVPILFCVPVYLFTWATRLGEFRSLISFRRFPIPAGVPGFLILLIVAWVAAPLAMIDTLGEEIGWSGLLTPRLVEITTFTRASAIRGILWSIWHYPLVIVLLPRYRRDLPIWYALTCMTISIMHAVSSNTQDVFEAVTKGTGPTHYITYEYGIGFAIILSILAFFVWRKTA
jgi:hypothetical protein